MADDNRFEIVLDERIMDSRRVGVWLVDTKILKDKETGVMYLFCSDGKGGGLVALLDADGKPING